MSNDLPSFHLYTGDLWKDQQFQLCEWQAQNLWLRMLTLLHDSIPRGEFRLSNGEPMTDEQIATLCQMPIADYSRLSSELLLNCVASRIAGAIANRRMVRERQVHETKREAGIKGADARWHNDSRENAKPIAGSIAENGSPDISSSSSSSSSDSKDKNAHSRANGAITDEEWILKLKANPAYQHIDFPMEFGKMDAWFTIPKNKHRHKTKAFILNWLNKIEKPMAIQPKKRTLIQ